MLWVAEHSATNRLPEKEGNLVDRVEPVARYGER
jgi:hypothetical protein